MPYLFRNHLKERKHIVLLQRGAFKSYTVYTHVRHVHRTQTTSSNGFWPATPLAQIIVFFFFLEAIKGVALEFLALKKMRCRLWWLSQRKHYLASTICVYTWRYSEKSMSVIFQIYNCKIKLYKYKIVPKIDFIYLNSTKFCLQKALFFRL